MSSESPYTPPKAVVQDTVVPSKVERRVLRDLVRILDNEAERLKLVRVLARTLWVIGIGAMVWTVLALGDAGSSAQWLAVLGMLGGFLAGISDFYFTSLRQWPVLRRYLDVDRIRADYEKSGS